MLDSTGYESVHSVAVARILNYCRSCQKDFSSVSAFDSHRFGRHEYTSSEGLRMDPPREDGRRCLTTREMTTPEADSGVPVFGLNKFGRWSLTVNLLRGREFRKEEG